ncbi:hypothetical protein A5662_03880 [Mycobacteriaceae bacterium 1482268.1]|nr:hypothetical protein A5662_03880 [Mycobacteriaceae bacterium 1482268.1]
MRDVAFITRETLGGLLVVGGIGASVACAVLGVKGTVIAVGTPLLVAGIWYAVRRPLVMLLAAVVIQVSNVAEVVGGRAAVLLVHLPTAFALLAWLLAMRDPANQRRLNRGTLVCIGLVGTYVVTQLLAALGSQNVDASTTQVRAVIGDCIFFVIALLLLQVTGKPWAVAAAIVVPLAVLCLLSLINQVGFGGTATFGGFAEIAQSQGYLKTPRYGGTTFDPNYWGRNLVLGLPLAAALAVRAFRSDRRAAALGWLASLMSLIVGVYMAQSRGTFIATAVVFLVWIMVSGPTARRRGVMSLPLMAGLLLLPGIGNRLVDVILDLSSSNPYRAVDQSVTARLVAQEISWAMFKDRPIFGFGPGVYTSEIPNYGGIVRTAYLEFQEGPVAPHNLYVQLAGQAGIVGLLGWVIFVGGCAWFTARHAARMKETETDRYLVAAVLAAIIGWSTASVFLHLTYFRTFSIVLAMAGALAFAADRDVYRPIATLRQMAHLVLAACLGIAAAFIVLAATSSKVYTASQRVTLLPAERMVDNYSWRYSYALAIRNRSVFIPTYAAMMASRAPTEVRIVPDEVRGVITINVTDRNLAAARNGLSTAIQQAQSRLSDFGTDVAYTLIPLGDSEESSGNAFPKLSIVLAVVIGIGVTAVSSVVRCRRTDPGRHRAAGRKNRSGSEQRPVRCS